MTVTMKASEVLKELTEDHWTVGHYVVEGCRLWRDTLGMLLSEATDHPCYCATGYLLKRAGFDFYSRNQSVGDVLLDTYGITSEQHTAIVIINDGDGLPAVIAYLEGEGL